MSILVATPAYGGNITLPHFHSCLALKEEFQAANIEHAWLTTANESLITRARNTMMSTFYKDTEFEYLLFLDADIEFRPDDVHKLWMLASDCDVAVGAYPMKRLDAPLSAWREGKLVTIEGETEPFEVDFAGTGFMLIKRKLIHDMIQVFKALEHEEGHIGRCWALFDTMIWNDTYLSEDYAFCHRARSIGAKIMCDPTINLIHHGQFAYGA
ncbi:MAG: glycosyltransferase [Alphaproteobacteria bacterium]